MEITLRRPHSSIPWGFRIIGGSDSHLPIIVSKVLENSIAENFGLEEDILLERINNIPTSGLTHHEVNQIILSADNELHFSARRENLENLILASLNDDDNNSEITNILRQVVSNKVIEEEKIREPTGKEELELQREFGILMTIDKNNNVKPETQSFERLIHENRSQQTLQLKDPPVGKRWSTFLQKPKNPTPKPKNQPAAIPKTDQYRVVIKKQPKRDNTAKAEDTVQMESSEVLKEEEEENLEAQNQLRPIEVEISFKEHIKEEIDITIEDEIAECQKFEQDERECGVNLDMTEENALLEMSEQIEQTKDDQEETNEDSLKITIEKVENAPSLEEQLAAVQRQLQELAQLPSAIQETLTVVTQQLASIVGEPKHDECEVKEEEHGQEEGITEPETDENTDSQEIEPGEDSDISVGHEHDFLEVPDPQSEVLSDICEEEEISENVEDINREPTDEELEQQRIHEENVAKQQLDDDEGQKCQKPVVRPIILPGGRKWVDPDDAVMKVKNTKMTDDKICNTLETFSEVIVGKTKGINFLKYTPPSKNLDYLQRSEVYRLIHGMEPPVKGISLRSEKILAEQDYYTAGGN